MEVYFQAFVNYKQVNQTQLISMIKFVYNYTKNASTGYTTFEFNCNYYLYTSYKKDLHPHFQ